MKNYDRNQELIPEGKGTGLFGAGHFPDSRTVFRFHFFMNFPSSVSDRLPRLRPPHPDFQLRSGVSFNPRYLCALLGKIGLSFQKAKFVSDKVGEEEYERSRKEWKEKTWPSILKTAKEKNKAKASSLLIASLLSLRISIPLKSFGETQKRTLRI